MIDATVQIVLRRARAIVGAAVRLTRVRKRWRLPDRIGYPAGDAQRRWCVLFKPRFLEEIEIEIQTRTKRVRDASEVVERSGWSDILGKVQRYGTAENSQRPC